MAVKLEHHSIDPSLLRDEFEIYESLAGGKGVPKVYWFGRESEFPSNGIRDPWSEPERSLQLLRPGFLAQDRVDAGRLDHCPTIVSSVEEYYSSRYQAGELLDGNGRKRQLCVRNRHGTCDGISPSRSTITCVWVAI